MPRSKFLELTLPGAVHLAWEEGVRAGSKKVDVPQIQNWLEADKVHKALNGAIHNIAGGDTGNTFLYANAIDAMEGIHQRASIVILNELDRHAAGTDSYRIVTDIRQILELPRTVATVHQLKPKQ